MIFELSSASPTALMSALMASADVDGYPGLKALRRPWRLRLRGDSGHEAGGEERRQDPRKHGHLLEENRAPALAPEALRRAQP
jgi:hypothetical protein